MISDASRLDSASTYSGSDHVTVGNGAHLTISHKGSLSISHNLQLRDVLVVSELTKNLLSISKLMHDFPVHVIFTESQFRIQNQDSGQLLTTGRLEHGLYRLDSPSAALSAVLTNKRLHASFDLWHYHLGYIA